MRLDLHCLYFEEQKLDPYNTFFLTMHCVRFSRRCLMNEMMNSCLYLFRIIIIKKKSWTFAAIWQGWKISSETLTEIALRLSLASGSGEAGLLDDSPFNGHVHKPCEPRHPKPITASHYGLGLVIGHNPPFHTHGLGAGFLFFIPEETSSGGWEAINHISFSGSMLLYCTRVSFAGFNRNNGKRNTVHSVFTVWTDGTF